LIEHERMKKAFEVYAEQGAGRSLRKLARQIGVSHGTVRLWSRKFRWTERLDEREREVVKAMAKASIKVEADTRLRNRQLLQLALVQIAKKLAEGKVRVTLADLDRLIRLESFLAGQADSRQEVIARDLQGKSLPELRELLRQEVSDLKSLTETPSEN
jgi:transposase-like protein